MLNVLMNGFVSFVVLFSSVSSVMPMVDVPKYNPMTSINYNEKEVSWYKNGVIGRHQMIKINSCVYDGQKCVQLLSDMYDGNALDNFVFEEEFTTVTSSTVSMKEAHSSEISTGLQVQAGIPEAELRGNAVDSKVFTIENTITHTVSQTSRKIVRFEAKKEAIQGKVFALGIVADVYKLNWKTWEWDDYWLGAQIVPGSTWIHNDYVVCNPIVTIVYMEGGFVS